MVEVKELGELLNLPNLEKDTITLINLKMREQINKIGTNNAVDKQDVMTIMDEYIHGAKEGV